MSIAVKPGGMVVFHDSAYVPRMALRNIDAGSGVIRVELVSLDAYGNVQTVLQSWDTEDDVAFFGAATTGPATVVALTNSTTVTPDDTIGPATEIVAAAGEATAADLTTTQAVRAELLDSISDLTGKVNELRTVLVDKGFIAA